MSNKTKNLSVAEYFLQIQKEYLIADFRRKIYYSPKDKKYWQNRLYGDSYVDVGGGGRRSNRR